MFALIYPHSFLTLLQGFILCASLIIAIGPQNLFILQQGVRGRHLFIIALLCTLFDLLLIAIGVGGLGAAIAANERWLTVTTLGGAAFLFGYGIRSFRSAWLAQPPDHAPDCAPSNYDLVSLRGTVLATLSFSFLNPAAYLDTVLMIGTAGSRFPFDQRVLFGVGAVIASGLWFFTLTYGASRLAPFLHHPAAWRTLDLVSGCIMTGIAFSLCNTHILWFW